MKRFFSTINAAVWKKLEYLRVNDGRGLRLLRDNVQGMEVGNEEAGRGVGSAPRSQGAACAAQTFPLTSQFLLSSHFSLGLYQGRHPAAAMGPAPAGEGGASA